MSDKKDWEIEQDTSSNGEDNSEQGWKAKSKDERQKATTWCAHPLSDTAPRTTSFTQTEENSWQDN